MKTNSLLFVFCLFLCLSACTQTPSWKGRIIHAFSNDVNAYNFSDKTEKRLFPEAIDPFVSTDGSIYFLNTKFQKRNVLIKKSTGGTQVTDVLDLSSENPQYKAQLEAYSVIRNTGIAGIMDYMNDPKVSPDGKLICVTIIGGYQKAFPVNCAAIFDIATQKLVAKFENKYYPSFTPDGRLLMSGSYKRGSSETSEYKAVTPGIFISDKSFTSLTRLDKGLNDPSPYHAVMSSDGKQVAYVLAGHIWIMKADGSDNRQLTDIDRDNIETYPCFSPDNRFVACWSYKTFEKSYYTAIAVVPANASKPVALTDKAAVWPRDSKNYRVSGGSGQMTWTK